METLAALGLAGNVVQFVQFASQLMKNASELRKSSTGCTADVLELEALYEQLRDLSANLSSGQGDAAAYLSRPSAAPFRNLLRICREDCDKLLAIVGQLRLPQQSSSKTWKSFRSALLTYWKKDEINELGRRLERIQAAITLQVCTMATSLHDAQFRQMEKVQAESHKLQIDQSTRIDEILKELRAIEIQVDSQAQNQRPDSTGLPQVPDGMHLLGRRFSSLQISQTILDREQSLLKSLDFSARPIRHRSIPEAHSKTFRWVFQPSQGAPSAATRLGHWLENSSGIFWISGKPGSGKSTFMKFVAGDDRTGKLVSQWATSMPSAISSHYFWAAGTSLQKSAEGLLRSLVFDIFRRCPEVREAICMRMMSPLGQKGDALEMADWTLSTLELVLHEVAKRNDLSAKFCIFIDGLDEYDGDHFELCQTLTSLAKSPHIKICLSSRPWTVFEEAFGSDAERKIYMHHLTREDILNYTHSRMNEHPRWSAIMASDPTQGKWLIEEVGRRATGVFLWVFLVTKQLRESFTNRDRVQDIRRRLESVPVELEAFFMQILDSVDAFYHDKMAITLQVAMEAEEILPAITLDFLEQEYDDNEYALKLPVQPLDDSEEEQLKEQASWWLNSRTRGLLEMDEGTGDITFLHRTVRDFLRTREMAEYLATKTPERFDIPSSVLKVYVAIIKRRQFDDPVSSSRGAVPSPNQCQLQSWVSAALCCAAGIADSGLPQSSSFKMLDELDRAMANKFRCRQAFWKQFEDGYQPETYFRLQLLGGTAKRFLDAKLRLDPEYFASLGHLLLSYMIDRNRELVKLGPFSSGAELLQSGEWLFYSENLPTLQLILDTQNINPNAFESPHGRPWSPWQWLINKMIVDTTGKMSDDEFWEVVNGGIVSRLLKRGANARALLENPGYFFGEAKFCSAFLIYMARAWVATPPTPGHAKRYLGELREFFKKNNPVGFDFVFSLSKYLRFLKEHAEFRLVAGRDLIVKSISLVLDLTAEDLRCPLRERRQWLSGVLAALHGFLPADMHRDLGARYSVLGDKIIIKRQREASTDLESGAPKAKRVCDC
ncbi:hypothetical protein B0T16DRAFT_411116 [Cercophora newfieldiana]|uniref:NACHT domain-containing protein n=1 Tax=Cercophora newfieldiana TaxID=92897 RepID=A0AA39Y467_9PEZI|nr:hypothetical protein B0T16DRAFT_411116 [Cercophora newfieldiana]